MANVAGERHQPVSYRSTFLPAELDSKLTQVDPVRVTSGVFVQSTDADFVFLNVSIDAERWRTFPSDLGLGVALAAARLGQFDPVQWHGVFGRFVVVLPRRFVGVVGGIEFLVHFTVQIRKIEFPHAAVASFWVVPFLLVVVRKERPERGYFILGLDETQNLKRRLQQTKRFRRATLVGVRHDYLFAVPMPRRRDMVGVYGVMHGTQLAESMTCPSTTNKVGIFKPHCPFPSAFVC